MEEMTTATMAVAAAVGFLMKEVVAGSMKEAGRQIFVRMQQKLSGSGRERVLQDLEQAPENPKIQGKLELLLEQAFEDDPETEKEFKTLLGTVDQPGQDSLRHFVNHGNFIHNSTIHVQGDFLMGGNKIENKHD